MSYIPPTPQPSLAGLMSYEGAWSGATAYVAGNVVRESSKTYVCVQAHTNQQPPNGTYWALLSDN